MISDTVYWTGSIFLFLFLTGIGLPPMPEEAGILYAAGLYAHDQVHWPLAWLACAVGILCADSVLYGVGRRFGPRLFEYRWVQKVMSTERRLRVEKKFHEHGIKILVAARFLPPLRLGVFLISGASRYSFFKFLLADAIYCVLGVGLFFFGGSAVIALIRRTGLVAVYIAAVPVAVYGLYRYYRYLKRRELAGAAPPASVAEVPAPAAPGDKPAVNPEAAPAARREARTVLDG